MSTYIVQAVPSAKWQVGFDFYCSLRQNRADKKWTPPQELLVYALTVGVRGKPVSRAQSERAEIQRYWIKKRENC